MRARALALAAALLAALFLPPARLALGQQELSEGERAALRALVGDAVAKGASGRPLAGPLSPRVQATVVPEKAVSRRTGQVCNECTEVCRPYRVTLEMDEGLTLLVYAGRSCAVGDGRSFLNARWTDAVAPTLVERRSPIPEATLAEAARLLVALRYLPASPSPPLAVMEALDAFRDDAQLGHPSGYRITDADLAALRRSSGYLANITYCPVAAGTYAACGRAE
ncbi:hypothetical protein NVS89_06795 [Ancylobacter sp. MQZ15Z-1]|uniref:Uncharacterized protein n=1 Tax=Ancylobacter mangrovi TaxID=2972472 RepID=A0A9X2PA08_9HYPH|nr:hypothetical protein [Ancylobacter mangrovi]MCS0494801.1 hypothetical protein [Ancylobacter mangrovi]